MSWNTVRCSLSIIINFTGGRSLNSIPPYHGLINYVDTKAKCCLLKKLTCIGTLRQVFRCLRPPPLLWPHSRSPYKLYTCKLYTYSHRERGRGERWTREKVRRAIAHKAGSEIPTWLTVSPVYKLWLTPAAKSLYRSIFLDNDILRCLLWVLSFYTPYGPSKRT